MNGLEYFLWLTMAQADGTAVSTSEVSAGMTAVKVGDVVRGMLTESSALADHGPVQWYSLVPEEDGELTLALDSYDFDAFLRVESPQAETLVEDDDSGIGDNSSLAFAAIRETRYRIAVAARHAGQVGEFVFSVQKDPAPKRSVAEVLDADQAWLARSAERALVRGDLGRAAYCRGSESGIAFDRGRYDEALSAVEAFLQLVIKRGDFQAQGKAYAQLTSVHHALGNYQQALEYNRMQREVWNQCLGSDGDFHVLVNLGVIQTTMGEFAKAKATLEQALPLTRQTSATFGVRWSLEATTLQILGMIHLRCGDYLAAREYAEQHLALAIARGSAEQEATALTELARVHVVLSENIRAREFLERSLFLARSNGLPFRVIGALHGLGQLFRQQGALSQAGECFQESLNLSRETGGQRDQCTALGNLALIRFEVGDLDLALEHSRNHYDLAHRLQLRDIEADALCTLSHIHRKRGDLETASESAHKALAIWGEIGSESGSLHAQIATIRAALARGQLDQADGDLRQAEGQLESRHILALEVEEAGSIRSRYSEFAEAEHDLVAARIESCGADPSEIICIAADGFARVGRWKGRALLEAMATLRSDARVPQMRQWRQARKERMAQRDVVLRRISMVLGKAASGPELDALRTQARELFEEIDRLSDSLAAGSASEAELRRPPAVSANDVQHVLKGPRSLLIDFEEGEEALYAYVLTPTQGPIFLTLGLRTEIDQEIRAYLDSISNPERLGTARTIASRGRALFDRLLAPALAAAGSKVDGMIIVPCAELCRLPIEALVSSAGAVNSLSFARLEFVLDRFEVSYAPACSVLVQLDRTPPRDSEPRVLVMADPYYEGVSQ